MLSACGGRTQIVAVFAGDYEFENDFRGNERMPARWKNLPLLLADTVKYA